MISHGYGHEIDRESGGPNQSVGARPEVVDFIPLSKISVVAGASEMVALYAAGHSLQQISRIVGRAKATVKSTLAANGVVLRPASGSQKFHALGQNERRSSLPPFGFVLLRNQFVPHPVEIEVVREIRALSKSGLRPRQIAERLNVLGHCTRSKKQWGCLAVANVLKNLKASRYPYSNEMK